MFPIAGAPKQTPPRAGEKGIARFGETIVSEKRAIGRVDKPGRRLLGLVLVGGLGLDPTIRRWRLAALVEVFGQLPFRLPPRLFVRYCRLRWRAERSPAQEPFARCAYLRAPRRRPFTRRRAEQGAGYRPSVTIQREVTHVLADGVAVAKAVITRQQLRIIAASASLPAGKAVGSGAAFGALDLVGQDSVEFRNQTRPGATSGLDGISPWHGEGPAHGNRC
jgi:hypothetical protein